MSMISGSTIAKPGKAASSLFMGLKIGVLTLEMVLIPYALLGAISLNAVLAVHFLLFCLLVAVIALVDHARIYSGDLQKFALQMLVAGPLGSASALIDEQLASWVRSERLVAWYDTIAPTPEQAVTLADRIRDDQLVRPKARLPKQIGSLIENGSMREKQALFASIVADGSMEGVNLIERALRSRDQRVRVQAAAVSASIRSKLRASASARPSRIAVPREAHVSHAPIVRDPGQPAA